MSVGLEARTRSVLCQYHQLISPTSKFVVILGGSFVVHAKGYERDNSLPRGLGKVKRPIPIFEYFCREAVIGVLRLIVVWTLRHIMSVLIAQIVIAHMRAGVGVGTTRVRSKHVLIIRWMRHMIVVRGQNAVITLPCL